MSEFSGEVCRRRETLEGVSLPSGAPLTDDIQIVLFSHSAAAGGSGGEAAGKQLARYSLKELYPHPPIYHGVGRSFLHGMASNFADRMSAVNDREDGDLAACLGGRVGLKQTTALYRAVLSLAKTPHSSDANHPLHLAAGVLFSSGEMVTERQFPALEYGCTVDAVTRLSAAMGGRVDSDHSKKDQPLLLLIVDQFGICHSPAAEPRSWLTEFAGGQIRAGLVILVHEGSTGKLLAVNPLTLAPLAPEIF